MRPFLAGTALFTALALFDAPPAAAMAPRAAARHMSDVVSSGAAMCRRRIPERSRIHSSEVSTIASNSLFVMTRSGR